MNFENFIFSIQIKIAEVSYFDNSMELWLGKLAQGLFN